MEMHLILFIGKGEKVMSYNLTPMTLETWELERQRAWTAFMAASMDVQGFNRGLADDVLLEWEKRFPKPE